MNIQQQDIDVIQHEKKWQAPELVELGAIANNTLNNQNSGGDGGSFFS